MKRKIYKFKYALPNVFLQQPEEIFWEIIQHLKEHEVLKLRQVCHYFDDLIYNILQNGAVRDVLPVLIGDVNINQMQKRQIDLIQSYLNKIINEYHKILDELKDKEAAIIPTATDSNYKKIHQLLSGINQQPYGIYSTIKSRHRTNIGGAILLSTLSVMFAISLGILIIAKIRENNLIPKNYLALALGIVSTGLIATIFSHGIFLCCSSPSDERSYKDFSIFCLLSDHKKLFQELQKIYPQFANLIQQKKPQTIGNLVKVIEEFIECSPAGAEEIVYQIEQLKCFTEKACDDLRTEKSQIEILTSNPEKYAKIKSLWSGQSERREIIHSNFQKINSSLFFRQNAEQQQRNQDDKEELEIFIASDDEEQSLLDNKKARSETPIFFRAN